MFGYLIVILDKKLMEAKILFTFILHFILGTAAIGNNLAGGEITYKYIGNSKYEATFRYYRNCNESRLTSPPISNLYCPANNQYRTLSLKLISITDISNTCKTAKNKCYPTNTKISSSEPSVEEFVYKDTLNFAGVDSIFNNQCSLLITMKECCRSSSITTGAKSEDFWVIASLELCKVKGNSSPVFTEKPKIVVQINNGAKILFSARDTIDGDSLSYEFVNPLAGLTSSVSWLSNFSKNKPFTDYWPVGYDKSRGPNPNVNTPIGTYLDPLNGILHFAPTNMEVGVVSVAVKEWRKDSTKKYINIGEIRRDIQIAVIVTNNKNPIFPFVLTSYNICEGETFMLDIPTDDKNFLPPPPEKVKIDSVAIEWDNGIKGASFSIVDSKVLHQTGRFVWTPPSGSIRKEPYKFTVKATDNYCPFVGNETKTISITVSKNVNLSRRITKLSNNQFELKIIADTSYKGKYSKIYSILDSNRNVINSNPIYNSVYELVYSSSSLKADTILFRKPGIYYIYSNVYASGYCNHYFIDTVIIKDIMDLDFGFGQGSFCVGQTNRIYAIVKGGVKPITYYWKTTTGTLIDTIGTFDYSVPIGIFSFYYKAVDANGKVNTYSNGISSNKNKPKFTLGNDTIICNGASVKLKAKKITNSNYSNPDPKQWIWTLNGLSVNFKDSFTSVIAGTYIVKAVDNYGCYYYDTINVVNFPLNKTVLINDQYCQGKNELSQTEIILEPTNTKVYSDMNWSVLKSLKDKSGNFNPIENLIEDLDTSSTFNFKISFVKSIIDLGTSKKDSLKFALETIDTFKCQSKDTLTLVLLKSPEILTNTSQSYCRNDAIDLTKKITSNLPTKIVAENYTGYDVWPLEGEIAKGIIKQKYFKPEGGIYFIRLSSVNETCIAVDSMHLTISPNPIASVNVDFIGDSVKFTDNSNYTTSRNWYVNSMLKTTNQSFVLSKSAAHFVPIKLELKNLNCSNDTTFNIKTLAIPYFKNDLISIYPNPVTQNLTIETGERKPYQVKVLNVLGQIVLQKVIYLPEETLDVANFSNGVYTLEISDKDIISRLKFIKE